MRSGMLCGGLSLLQCLALLRSFVLNVSWCICTTNLFGGPESRQHPVAFNCCDSAGPLNLPVVVRHHKCLSVYYLQCSGNFKVHPSTPCSGSGLSVMELICHFLGLVCFILGLSCLPMSQHNCKILSWNVRGLNELARRDSVQ
jgi:hypothetical protein